MRPSALEPARHRETVRGPAFHSIRTSSLFRISGFFVDPSRRTIYFHGMKIELRPATIDDMPFIYEVTEASMRVYVEQTLGPWVPEIQHELIKGSIDSTTHQIITADGIAVGVLAGQTYETHIQLEKLYLSPSFQGRGIGTGLVQGLVASATALTKPIRLRVLVANTAAQRFYARLGFVVAHTTPERVFMERRIR
jgi:ribosomal protein S18 acetylase RimI-like enzyme